MRVALLTSFAASKKEPLVEMMNRVQQAVAAAGLPDTVIRFSFADAPVYGSNSPVDRALKRHPELQRFVTETPPAPGLPGMRRIANGPGSEAESETLPYDVLQALAAGVPRSFPFHGVVIHFVAPEFGATDVVVAPGASLEPGVILTDSWWVSGRVRSLSACTLVDADPSARTLPALPPAVAAVLAACGKAKKTVQAPLPHAGVSPGDGPATGSAPQDPAVAAGGATIAPEVGPAVRQLVEDYRARLPELVRHAALPYDLPPRLEAIRANVGASAGPRKPALEAAFKPLGYGCKGGSGTFTLRRRTAANLTVELELDVGTWSNLVVATFRVWGMGYRAGLPLPVGPGTKPGEQYPIGDAEQWAKIVANLAALVRELDRTFVPDLERVAGPSPEWYRPES